MEDVALEPTVLTRWVVSHVPVTTDIPEMDLLVLVSYSKHLLSNKIRVQTNAESVQCLCLNTKHNRVGITQVNEQLT